jgi:hypothetical protein
MMSRRCPTGSLIRTLLDFADTFGFAISQFDQSTRPLSIKKSGHNPGYLSFLIAA